MTKTEIKRRATEFRAMMEHYCSNLEYNHPRGLTLLKDFPSGCCHDTSLLLSRYLRECGANPITSILTIEHVWLKVGDFYVDITADQFGTDEFEPVEVVERMDPRYRYLISKAGANKDSSDYWKYDNALCESFDRVYDEITERIANVQMAYH